MKTRSRAHVAYRKPAPAFFLLAGEPTIMDAGSKVACFVLLDPIASFD
jgi:hypothetical protein